MNKKAFLFPGQGSQEIGMGKDLIEVKDNFTLSLFKYGSEILNEDLIEICLKGPIDKLTQPHFLQASLVCVCLGYWNRLVKEGIKSDFIVGHSLGEITALAASKVVSPEECLSIAIKRGQLMYDVAKKVNGGMLTVMLITALEVKQILEELKVEPDVVIANYNSVNQTVLSGKKEILEKVKNFITSQKFSKCLWIKVDGPWHSPFMKNAEIEFENWVSNFTFHSPKIPIIFNGTGETEYNPEVIKKIITRQLSGPVYWDKCMAKLKEKEVDTFLEIGPRTILSGLLKVNGFKGCNFYHIDLHSIKGLTHLSQKQYHRLSCEK